MLYEEVIDWLYDMKHDVKYDEQADAIDMAIECVHKQIPKKPKKETINHGIDMFGEYDIESNYMCANCGTIVGDYEKHEMYFKFCPDCGQKIDWSDDNDD